MIVSLKRKQQSKLLLFFFLFLLIKTEFVNTQNDFKEKNFSYKVFNTKDGFDVFNVNAMLFDDLGWLWIAGTNLNANNTLLNHQPIMQRYDGNSFYSLDLPDFHNALNPEVTLVKRQDGQFYVIFSSDNIEKLFIISPNDLIFKEIELPLGKTYQDLFLFNYNENALLYLRDGIDTRLYQLNSNTLQLKELPHKPITKQDINDKPYYSSFIPFKNHFIIDDTRNGIYSYNPDGSVDKVITHKSLGLEKTLANKRLSITTWFKKDNKTYVLFDDIEGYFQYNSELKTWTKTNIFNTDANNSNNFSHLETVFTDDLGHIMQQKITQKGQVNNFYFNGFEKAKRIEIPILSNTKIASRNYKKEFYTVVQGEFRHYSFKDKNIETFLEDKSIRGLLQLNKNEIIVSTENSGWYGINLSTKEEKAIELTLNNKPYLGNGNRAIFNSENYFWGNDNNGIIKVEKDTKKVTSFIYFPITDMFADERYIYYGTNKQNLMKFDKLLEKNIVITPNNDYKVQGILKRKDTIYLASTEGVLVYENQNIKEYKPNQIEDDNYFIAIAHHNKYGILLGSRSGKLFQFNSQNNTFKLLYSDALKASIATLLFDQSDRIWMNTFNGVVAFNPNTESINRYTMTDGLSFYEANRYSAIRTNEGHFLVGTLKGLNYFHPDTISNTTVNAKLVLTSLTYFNTKLGKETTTSAPNELNNIKNLNLPPDNKSISIAYGLLGIYDSNKINYRYRLNQGEWIKLAKTNELKLFSLSAGDYILEIEAIDSANKSIGKALKLSITVNALFYKTIWFVLLIVLVFFTIGFWYNNEQQKKYKLKEQFSKQILNSQEAERTRVAKELHDGVGQQLMLLTRRSKNQNDPIMENLAKNTLANVRSISQGLHPVVLERLGFTAAVKDLVNSIDEDSDLFFTVAITDIDSIINDTEALHLFRIVQETLTNIMKHAQATAVFIDVTLKNETLNIAIKDNGKGFNYTKAQNTSISLGLKSLAERSKIINALLVVESQINKGTTIQVKLPVSKAKLSQKNT